MSRQRPEPKPRSPLLACLALLLLLGGLAPSSAQAQAQGGGSPPPRAEREGTLQLRASLLPGPNGRPFRGRALVGPAVVSEADRQLWEAQQQRGGARAGPRRLEELARTSQWLPAEVKQDPRGGATLGPLPVPRASRYRILAWDESGTLYQAEFVPSSLPEMGVLDAGALSATAPTGLALRLQNVRPGKRRYSVRIEGLSDPESASRVTDALPALEVIAPPLLRALRGTEVLPLPPSGRLPLTPLPPFRAVRLRLVTEAGLESAPVEVPLRPGEVVPFSLDAERLFAGGEAALADLRGRVQVGASSQVPPGTTIERLEGPGAPGRARQELAADGSFTFQGLPAGQPSRFRVRVPRPATGRGPYPPSFDFTHSPQAGAREPAEVLWQVPLPYGLTLKLDPRLRLEAGQDAAYPVFLVQRQEAGQWRTQPTEEFTRGEGRVDISLLQPGTYRVIAAASPALLYESDAVEVGEQQRQAVVALQSLAPGAPCEVRVTSASTGRPLAGVSLALAAPFPSLPPVRAVTDAQGRFLLERVHARELHLEIEHPGSEPLAQDIAGPCARSGVADLRVPW